jgi:hypothetical protein
MSSWENESGRLIKHLGHLRVSRGAGVETVPGDVLRVAAELGILCVQVHDHGSMAARAEVWRARVASSVSRSAL